MCVYIPPAVILQAEPAVFFCLPLVEGVSFSRFPVLAFPAGWSGLGADRNTKDRVSRLRTFFVASVRTVYPKVPP